MTLTATAYFWVGTNANLFFLSVGVVALDIGLDVWEALVAVVLGTSLFVAVGLASIGGVRSGLPTLTFTRAAFGPIGNVPNGVLTWATLVAFEAINCIFAVFALLALMAELGWEHPGDTGKVLATLTVLAASGAIAVYGHATMVYLQRGFAVSLTLVLALVLAYSIGGVNWSASAHADINGWETLALILAGGAVVASGPISYLFNAPDFVRYLPSRTSSRSILWTVSLSSGLIALFLSVLGVLLASRGDMSDPIAGVEPFVPGWLFVLYILAAVGGSIAPSRCTSCASSRAGFIPRRSSTACGPRSSRWPRGRRSRRRSPTTSPAISPVPSSSPSTSSPAKGSRTWPSTRERPRHRCASGAARRAWSSRSPTTASAGPTLPPARGCVAWPIASRCWTGCCPSRARPAEGRSSGRSCHARTEAGLSRRSVTVGRRRPRRCEPER
jgi:hypothetical protein